MQLCLHAPPCWKEGQPLYFSHPPTPLPEEMRRGKLAEYNKRNESMYTDNKIFPIQNENLNGIPNQEDDKAISRRISTYVSSAADLKANVCSKSESNCIPSLNNNEIDISKVILSQSNPMDVCESKEALDMENERQLVEEAGAEVFLNKRIHHINQMDANVIDEEVNKAVTTATNRKTRSIQINFGMDSDSDSESENAAQVIEE